MPMPRLRIVTCEPSRIKASDWVNLEEKLNALNCDWQFGEILGFDDLNTIKFKETDTDIFILAKVSSEPLCSCGATPNDLKKNGWTSLREVTDSPHRYKRTTIYFRAQRYRCEKCRKTLQQKTISVHKHHRLTTRLVSYIEKASLRMTSNFSDLSFETGTHEKTVRKIFSVHGKGLEKNRIIVTPEWLAVDELCLSNRKSARCVITDPVGRKVLDILEGNDYATISKCLLQLPERHKVKVVSMDMHKPYRLIVNTVFKNAVKIVVDRYHVQNLINKALKETHQVIRATLTAKEQEEHPVSEHLLLKSRRHLSDKNPKSIKKSKSMEIKIENEKKLAVWFRDFPDLARAYTLKEDFSDILNLANRQLADQRAAVWLTQVKEFHSYFWAKYKIQCRRLNKNPFGNIFGTMDFWMDCILNYIDFKYMFRIKVTNAFAESANRKIREAYRKANGCSFEVLRTKVVYGDFVKEQLPSQGIRNRKKHGSRKSRRNNVREFPRNPESNVEGLRKAREDNDKTKGLIPTPQDFKAWKDRFSSYVESDEKAAEDFNQNPASDFEQSSLPAKDSKRLQKEKSRKKRKGDSTPEQPTLF